jgi:hypothetical protein
MPFCPFEGQEQSRCCLLVAACPTLSTDAHAGGAVMTETATSDEHATVTAEPAAIEAEIAEATELALAAIATRYEQASAALEALVEQYCDTDADQQVILSA